MLHTTLCDIRETVLGEKKKETLDFRRDTKPIKERVLACTTNDKHVLTGEYSASDKIIIKALSKEKRKWFDSLTEKADEATHFSCAKQHPLLADLLEI